MILIFVRDLKIPVHLDGDLICKPRMIHRQTSNDSIVLMKDTGVIRGFPINGDQRKVEKKLHCPTSKPIKIGFIIEHIQN